MELSEVERFMQSQKKQCEHLFIEHIQGNFTNLRCPPSFDGILCWPRQLAPGIAAILCPPQYILGYRSPATATATKRCLANGEWYRNDEDVTWSNYTLCTPPAGHYVTAVTDLKISHFEYEETSNSTLLTIGYATSFTTLVIAMVVFSLLRKLRNPRNRLHMHLFASFIMRAFMALLKDWLFVDGIGLAWDVVTVDGRSTFIKERNIWVCKAITSLWQYFIVANYAWILMEGVYLHNLVFLALCADTSSITIYVLMGWALPALVVIVWIFIRVIMEDTLCWTTHNNPSLFLIIRIPIIISILFNFVLFINIVRVLLIKMKTSVHLQRKKMQYGRWAKSTLVLVPLFGAHYTLFLGLAYHDNQLVELIWLFCDQLFASFQGCFVAFLYCLLNGEVRAEVRRVWRAQRSRRGVDSFLMPNRKLGKSSDPGPRKTGHDHLVNNEKARTNVSTL
ncbi:parathyroid hormone 2 receptor-like isoform X2 [Venturia canescens]|uniref:parathyroid hormone 2 receptor-like isoform X2 n=1 Tax=Venturia canescens TaxID=32260 RepID=UPI001C9C3EDD|nr:parathyroid hormone 2 receptor-like isoform X2 [Venturia canescens]